MAKVLPIEVEENSPNKYFYWGGTLLTVALISAIAMFALSVPGRVSCVGNASCILDFEALYQSLISNPFNLLSIIFFTSLFLCWGCLFKLKQRLFQWHESYKKSIEENAIERLKKGAEMTILKTKEATELKRDREALHRSNEEKRELHHKLSELLGRVLPEKVIGKFDKRLPADGDVKELAELKKGVTILFADIVGFTAYCESTESEIVVSKLHKVFNEFDGIAKREKLEKIKTIGDCYMLAGGLFTDDEQVKEVLNFAVAARSRIKDHNPAWSLRIGIAAGNITAGIIGNDKLIYDVWGDVVNTASRMESCSKPNEILVTDEVVQLAPKGKCRFSKPHKFRVKGKSQEIVGHFVERVS